MTSPQRHTLATTPATVQHHGFAFSHRPVVHAMLTNNRMRNCHDVAAMVTDCQESGNNDRICRVANQYLNACLQKGKSLETQ